MSDHLILACPGIEGADQPFQHGLVQTGRRLNVAGYRRPALCILRERDGSGEWRHGHCDAAAALRRARISSKRLETSRMIAAMPSIRPVSSLNGTMVNSIEMRDPSLRMAGTARRSPAPYRVTPVRMVCS